MENNKIKEIQEEGLRLLKFRQYRTFMDFFKALLSDKDYFSSIKKETYIEKFFGIYNSLCSELACYKGGVSLIDSVKYYGIKMLFKTFYYLEIIDKITTQVDIVKRGQIYKVKEGEYALIGLTDSVLYGEKDADDDDIFYSYILNDGYGESVCVPENNDLAALWELVYSPSAVDEKEALKEGMKEFVKYLKTDESTPMIGRIYNSDYNSFLITAIFDQEERFYYSMLDNGSHHDLQSVDKSDLLLFNPSKDDPTEALQGGFLEFTKYITE